MLINAVVPLCQRFTKTETNFVTILLLLLCTWTFSPPNCNCNQSTAVGQAKHLAPIRLLTSLVKYSGSKAKLERFLLCQITPLWQIQHSDRSDNRHPTGRTAVAAAVASVWSAASLVVSCFLRLQLNRPPATGDPPLPWYTWGWGWLRAVDHRPFLRSFPGPPPSVYAHWWFQKKVSLHGCS